MFQTICQWILLLNLVFSFFFNTYRDFNGYAGKTPQGFDGFIGTCLAIVGMAILFAGAGVFDSLLEPIQ